MLRDCRRSQIYVAHEKMPDHFFRGEIFPDSTDVYELSILLRASSRPSIL